MSLVTITVGTFNSSKFVIETLDSIVKQTWEEIELIIKDDASTDNTVRLCRNWIDKNRSRFVRTKILAVTENTGMPANFNRGIHASNGLWIKPIAGDDALLPNCIRDNMEYVQSHPETKVLFSYNRLYKDEFKVDNFLRLSPGSLPAHIITPDISAHEQYRLLLSGDKIPFTPSIFINKAALLDAGLPDEDLFSEDYQTKLKLTRGGYKFEFMEKETVNYRVHDNAINNTIREYILKPHYFKTESFRERYIYPNVPKDIHLHQKYGWIVNQVFRIPFFNRKNKFNGLMYFILNSVLNPFKYVIYIKSHYISRFKDDVFYRL